MRISITPGVELGSSKDLPFLIYYNALEWKNKFNLFRTEHAAKNIALIEKIR